MAVTSAQFTGAANVQAESLGLPEARHVDVPHPIQDATDDEMGAKADGVVDEIIEALVVRSKPKRVLYLDEVGPDIGGS